MSNDKPIPLEGIPVFTGNLATLDVKVTELTSAAETIATTTGDVHSSFGGLQAFYKAPEADQLFATTKPVATSGQTLKSDLKSIAGALSAYSDEVHPLVEKLKEIKRDAGAFLVKINADDKWREDGDLVEENNHRRDEIAETLAAFQEAEVACYNKIVALVCLLPLKTSDGSESKNQYGYDAETLKHAEGLPWGDPLVESTPGWQVWEHAWDFTKGFFVDGVWGTIKGLGTLVGYDGFEAAGQAWKGLAQLATGVAISLSPVAAVQYWTAKDEDLPTWLRESRTAVKETGKALIAYDQWGENPSRAAGAVTFNVVTTVFTGGTGGAVAGGGKAALAAKALSAAGKVGRFVDPMTYIFKGAGFGLTKIGDVMTGLKGLGTIEIPPLPDNVFTLPEGAVRLSDGTVDLPAGAAIPDGAVRLADGTVRLPEGVIALPEGTIKNPFDEGAAYADDKGNLYDESGNLVQRAEDARTEPGKTHADTPDHARVDNPVRQPVLAGAGAHGGSNIGDGIRLGDNLSDFGRVGDDAPAHATADHTPGGRIPDNTPTNNLDNTPRGGDRTEGPSATGHGGGPAGAGTHMDGPDVGGRNEPPTGGGGTHPPQTPGAGGLDDAAHGVDDAAQPTHSTGDRQLTAEEIKVKQDEFVRRANNPDKSWFDLYYRSDGHRLSVHTKIDGVELPILAKDSNGSWISKHDLPSAPSETRFGRDPLARGSAPVDQIDHLDDVAKDRKVSVDLSNAERAHKIAPTDQTLAEVQRARQQFIDHFDDQTSNNSSYSERLGEDAARLHVASERFEGAVEQPLPKTPNGANMFDQLYRRPDGKLVIIEAKAPGSGLIWRRGKGAAADLMVQQGTRHYLETILAEMEARPALSVIDETGKVWTNAELVAELRPALDNGNLEYAMVKAVEGKGSYAGAVLEYFKI
ncbi:hypothetical protein AB0L83_10165 [Streptomyces sp. NPDC052071]|uniref:Protein phosphatase n=1 Tax=[Kitasatospora] papulosa TaxID=1464011 RepID=A0ABZ1K509_9ACTN|nr:hypothetical protein [[Kitasatospora] papulosa]TPN25022.1 hypothetical protein FKO01_27190 [Mesorhizobium sp. B2-3-3]